MAGAPRVTLTCEVAFRFRPVSVSTLPALPTSAAPFWTVTLPAVPVPPSEASEATLTGPVAPDWSPLMSRVPAETVVFPA